MYLLKLFVYCYLLTFSLDRNQLCVCMFIKMTFKMAADDCFFTTAQHRGGYTLLFYRLKPEVFGSKVCPGGGTLKTPSWIKCIHFLS